MRRVTRPAAMGVPRFISRGIHGDPSGGFLPVVYPTSLYSLRWRNPSYLGACVRVKRLSDSAEQDFGFDGTGWLDIGAVSAFVGAGVGVVKKWYDQVGSVDLSDSADKMFLVQSGVVATNNSRPIIALANGVSVSVAANSAFALGTAAWTFEIFHVPINNGDVGQMILDFRDGGSGTQAAWYNSYGNVPTFFNGANNAGASTLTFSSFVHQAIDYVGGSGSTLRLYTGGVVTHSMSTSNAFSGNRPLRFGQSYTNTLDLVSRVTELRIARGVCQYNGAFTAPDYYA